MNENLLLESLTRYIGQTVTIFTTSGGLSGEGFTGVLAAVSECAVKLITDIGAAPSCPVGSTCSGYGNGYGNGYGYGSYGGGYGGYSGGWGNGFGNFGWGGGCNSGCNSCGNSCGCNGGGNYNWLGSVTEIPICKIASFTHNAI